MSEKINKSAPSKYGALIQKAREPENQQDGKPENQLSGLPDENQRQLTPQSAEQSAEMVNLSIKVDKKRRRHWATEAKRNDTTLVAAITEALLARFGEPEN